MKTTIIKLVLFAIVFFFIDFLGGRFFSSVQNKVKGGSTGKINYIANEAKEDILIFGSSKGESNYNPDILSKSLGMSCYNCARNSNGIILMYGRYKMLTERYIPKIIIYDIRPSFDYYKGNNSAYLTFLKPFYGRNGIDSLFWSIDKNERIKMCSQLYRYNYYFLEVLKSPKDAAVHDNGFSVDKRVMKSIPKKVEPAAQSEFDELKLHYMEELIKNCKQKNVLLLFVSSPEYYHYSNFNYEPIQNLSQKYDIPFLDLSNDSDFVGNKNYFIESVHMNYEGANIFSNKIANLIHSYLK